MIQANKTERKTNKNGSISKSCNPLLFIGTVITLYLKRTCMCLIEIIFFFESNIWNSDLSLLSLNFDPIFGVKYKYPIEIALITISLCLDILDNDSQFW